MIGYLNKAVLTSCFAGGVTAALSRIYLIHRDEKEDQCSTTQTVRIQHFPLFFIGIFISILDIESLEIVWFGTCNPVALSCSSPDGRFSPSLDLDAMLINRVGFYLVAINGFQ
ncbi:hypothetical protein DM860_011000 [Cuscuta australis]|uniref:Uncharacterized protein n=1 Tax=Cuscuta australis TaxID=267555 RepID=A0A328E480_9ASTE|nr:hypothetical protein DM860_011000 [Cuscuta australis]